MWLVEAVGRRPGVLERPGALECQATWMRCSGPIILPSLMTRIRSASRIVESLCAITKLVLPSGNDYLWRLALESASLPGATQPDLTL